MVDKQLTIKVLHCNNFITLQYAKPNKMKKLLPFLTFVLIAATAYPQCIVQQQFTNPTTCSNSCDGLVGLSVFGGVPPYTMTVSPNPIIGPIFTSSTFIDSLCPGVYNYSIADQGGCQVLGTFTILSPPPLVVVTSVIQPSCPTCPDGVIIANVTGGTPPYTYLWSIGATGPTIGNLTAGVYMITVVDANGCSTTNSAIVGTGGPNNYLVEGIVYLDLDSNGVQGPGEQGLPWQTVKLLPNNWTGYTNAAGQYYFGLPAGNYSVTVAPNNGWVISSVPDTMAFTVASANISGLDFGIKPIQFNNAINGTITGGWPRCGFGVGHYISYQNSGTLPCASVKVEFSYDAALTYTSSSITPDSVIGNKLVWIRPGLYSQQIGNLYSTLIMPLAAGTVLTSYLKTTSFDSLGNVLATDMDTLVKTVTCSYDPNDKQVIPEGMFAQHITPKSSLLDYTIRFQNTGNDTAYTVVLVDTLDISLDRSTFAIINSSHTVNTVMNDNGVLTFNFDNIMLADSIVDEPNSHGFVRFSIQALGTIPDPTVVYNTAYIYFDFNAAIITNTTFNTLSDLTTGVPVVKSKTADLLVYPNPVRDQLSIQLDQTQASYQISLWSSDGREARNLRKLQGGIVSMDVRGLSQGIYLLKVIEMNTGAQQQVRVMISR